MEKDIYQLSNLTPEQLVMWAGQKLHQDCPIYNVPCIFTFNQKINLETFQKAFQLLLDVTHTLKTVIREVEGIPQQMIIQNFHYTLENIDLTIFSDSSEQLEIWLDKRKGIVFNLEQQLFDSALIKKSENEFIWYINQHHIITDGWSISLLLKIMSDIYEKLEKGLADKDIGLPLFLDYAEKGKAQTVRRKNSSVYWENKLNKSK